MIRLVLLMLRSRWAQGLTLAVLAMVAIASAVAGPAYLSAVDRAVVDHERGAASQSERSVSISAAVNIGSDQGGGPGFSAVGPALISMPDFTPVFSLDLTVVGLDPSPTASTRYVYRQDVCSHLVMVTGRCLIGGTEVLVGQRTADRLGIRAGSLVSVEYGVIDQNRKVYVAGGQPQTLTVAGIYRVPHPAELYWGTGNYFAFDASGQPREPLFTDRATFATLDHQTELDTVDVLGADRAFAPDHLETTRENLSAVENRLDSVGSGLTVTTSIPNLLGRIDRGRVLAHEVVPVAAVPLVVLAWFVIFLAVGYGTEGRRFELGLVALRGASRPARWILAAGEHLVAIVLGAAVGYPLGLLAAGALASARLDGPGTGAGTLRYALGAAAGAVLAALLAQRRELFAPVAELLRQVSGGARRWRSLAIEVVFVVLAVVAVVQLQAGGGRLTGLGELVPALVILAVALVTARAVVPLAARYGMRAMRRGRTGTALAALQLGRRPGIHRLFVLLVVAIALLGFGITAFDVAAQARTQEAQVDAGAARVLTVAPVTRLKLLNATRAIDPRGRYAMAVAREPGGAPGDPPQIAVDTTRLATVAAWRPEFGGPGPARLSALLRPPLPDPTVVRAGGIEVDVTADAWARVADLDLWVTLAPLSGALPLVEDLGKLSVGDQTLVSQVDGCRDGCRLVGFNVTRSGSGGVTLHLTVHQVHTVEPAGVVLSAAQLADASTWRPAVPHAAALTGDAAGLNVDYHNDEATQAGGWIYPTDRPEQLPVAGTVALPAGSELIGMDGLPTKVTEVGRLAGLPRLGVRGVLVDLEYADRWANDALAADGEEVWLGPSAPPDVVDRLRAQGVVVIGQSGIAELRSRLDGQGPAMALWFHLLTAALAVLLAAGGVRLVAAVDRDRRAADLRALRIQGVPGSVTGRAGLWGYLIVVLAALLVGMLATAVAWAVVGAYLPTSVDQVTSWPAPVSPNPAAVLWPWAVAAAALVGVAVRAAYDLSRRVRQRPGADDGRQR